MPDMMNPTHRSIVLVVDDDINFVTMLRTDLRTEGYEVVSATDAFTAERMAWDLRPSLIITDILMPGIDGMAMMESIHSKKELRHIPVIFLSGQAKENFEKEDPKSGTRYALLKKPLFLPEFNQLVRRYLGK